MYRGLKVGPFLSSQTVDSMKMVDFDNYDYRDNDILYYY